MIERKPPDTSSMAPLSTQLGDMTPCTPEQEDAARLAVCGAANGAEDAEMLLQMLGLIPSPATPERKRKHLGGNQWKAERRRKELAPCGTNAAYQRHHVRGETACDPCREAHRNYRAGRA